MLFLFVWLFFFNVSCTWVNIVSSSLKCALRVLMRKWKQYKRNVINHCKPLAMLVRDSSWAIVVTLFGPYCFEVQLHLKIQNSLKNLLWGETWSWLTETFVSRCARWDGEKEGGINTGPIVSFPESLKIYSCDDNV